MGRYAIADAMMVIDGHRLIKLSQTGKWGDKMDMATWSYWPVIGHNISQYGQ